MFKPVCRDIGTFSNLDVLQQSMVSESLHSTYMREGYEYAAKGSSALWPRLCFSFRSVAHYSSWGVFSLLTKVLVHFFHIVLGKYFFSYCVFHTQECRSSYMYSWDIIKATMGLRFMSMKNNDITRCEGNLSL